MQINKSLFVDNPSDIDEIHESDIVSKGLLVLTQMEVDKFDKDLLGLIHKGETSALTAEEFDSLEKASHDRSQLVKKVVVDKNGKRTTKWVKTESDNNESGSKTEKYDVGDLISFEDINNKYHSNAKIERITPSGRYLVNIDGTQHTVDANSVKVGRRIVGGGEYKVGETVSFKTRTRGLGGSEITSGKYVGKDINSNSTGFHILKTDDGEKRTFHESWVVPTKESKDKDKSGTSKFEDHDNMADFHDEQVKYSEGSQKKFHEKMADYHRGGVLTPIEHERAAKYHAGIVDMDKEAAKGEGEKYVPTMHDDVVKHHKSKINAPASDKDNKILSTLKDGSKGGYSSSKEVIDEAYAKHQHNLKVQRQGKEASLKQILAKYGREVEQKVRELHEAPVKAVEAKSEESNTNNNIKERTKSGKRIGKWHYATASMYSKFTPEDHNDAANYHRIKADESLKISNVVSGSDKDKALNDYNSHKELEEGHVNKSKELLASEKIKRNNEGMNGIMGRLKSGSSD